MSEEAFEQQESVVYRLQVIGGPYDGVPGLHWVDDGEHPPPDEIFVGQCPGDGSCGAGAFGGMSWCKPTKRHVGFWTDHEDVPTRTVRYEKEDDWVVRREFEDEVEFVGEARYAMGGLGFLAPMRIEEAVPAGAAA